MSGDAVPIAQLPITHLVEIAKQYKQKIDFLSTSIKQLKLLQNQFSSSKDCLKTFQPENKDSEILVPLTSTLCVPGHLKDVDNVMIDIGTGYFVEMVSLNKFTFQSIDQANSHFKRRMEHLDKQVEKIAPILEQSIQIHRSVSLVLREKETAESKSSSGTD
ncbi:unnamed protein product [Protopolystoma xenopodis]|uniref:Prefoldin subunit 5 n=1 Tax=Protopolystoma xenopodis TaxID=117903 RepID=A0A3S5AL16_9PLAT|nr:unnamed protein product [Protopolystoma xenopodis]